MKIRFLNNVKSNKRFDYTPMYYDQRKEERERKRAYYEKLETGEIGEEERRAMFRENLKSGLSRGEMRQSQNRSANIRVLLLIVLLLALGYFMFNGIDRVDTVVKKVF